MCGLVGWYSSSANGFHFKEREAFQDMVYMDALRGVDATGVMYGTLRGDIQIHKEASPAPVFLDSKEWEKTSNELFGSGVWAFAHNRAATRGSKSDENSHPFNIDDKIILMQNGTYLGSHHHHKNTEVDTEACAHVFAESSSVQEAISKINAAYAFIWCNVEESSINLLRNKERPLWWALTEAGSYVFSSEPGILSAATSRRGVALKEGPKEVPVGEHWKITKEKGQINIVKEMLDVSYKGSFRQDDDEYTSWWASRNYKTGKDNLPTVRQIPNRAVSNRRGFQTISDAVLSVQGAYASAVDSSEAETILEAFRGLSSPVMIEAIDYAAVDPTDVQCDQFYIIGQVVAPESDPLANLFVAWTVTNEGKEQKLIDYITDNLFSGRISNMIRRAKPTPSGYSPEEVILIGQVTDVEIATILEAH